MSPATAYGKDRTYVVVQKEYSEKWGHVLQAIRNRIEKGNACMDSLIREGIKAQLRVSKNLTTFDALYGSYRDIALKAGKEARRFKPDAIIELGAGWGVNLANIWADSWIFPDGAALQDMTYWGLEPVAAGRAVMEELGDHSPKFDIQPRHYDFNEPEYWLMSAGIPKYRKVLVITCHAIEQIPSVKREVFLSLMNRFGEVRAMHFEPVGWQPGKPPDYVVENGYNRNLVTALHAARTSKPSMSVPKMTPDVSIINPSNPTALVEWQKI